MTKTTKIILLITILISAIVAIKKKEVSLPFYRPNKTGIKSIEYTPTGDIEDVNGNFNKESDNSHVWDNAKG